MPKIYTKTGDKGSTGLFNGERVSKADALVNAYGTVDELNAVLGIARSHHRTDDRLAHMLAALQVQLLECGADMGSGSATASRINDGYVAQFEAWIDELQEEMEPLKNFIIPGGHLAASHLHHARTICRRAERMSVAASTSRELDPVIVRYLNRLADLLFVLARYANHVNGVEDVKWQT
jgi:cob(I)alamin adenosyltransferase